MKLRSTLVSPGLKVKIEEYKKAGKELVVIDDWMLPTHRWLDERISKKYTIRRKFLNRREGLKIRSNLT